MSGSGAQRRRNVCPSVQPARAGAVVRVFAICNKKGLHARASAKFVQTVEKFDADVRVTRCGETVGGTSIMGLMMLAAVPGTSITVEATGRQAAEVVEAWPLSSPRVSARTVDRAAAADESRIDESWIIVAQTPQASGQSDYAAAR